jgi:cobalt-zinc-cadmium efflux system membrane fusion protein
VRVSAAASVLPAGFFAVARPARAVQRPACSVNRLLHRIFFVAFLASAACHRAHGSEPGVVAPPGEAWLSDAQMRDAKIEVADVAEHDVDDTIVTAGRVTFDDALVGHVYSPVAGRVARIDATLGMHVKKGQALAVIESPDIGLASSDVGKAEADLLAAQHEYEREKDLFAQHAASQRDFEAAEDAYRRAKAELERARQKAALFRTGGATAVTQGFALTAPIDGEVIARNLSPGIEVSGLYGGGTPVELFTIGELGRVWIMADVHEMDLARVSVGARVTVDVVAHPGRKFEGKVDWVSGALDPSTRTVKLRATFANEDRALLPEMYATVRISVEERKALALPRPAIMRVGDQTVAFVVKGKTADGRTAFVRRPVTIDEGEGSDWVAVTHGLAIGERVATSGVVILSQSVTRASAAEP